MRLVVALVALAGCNSIFDLRSTQQIDAAYFDAPIDAPYQCPASGAPAFSTALHQVVLQECTGYVVAENGRAFASCRDGFDPAGAFEGDVDQPLHPASGVPRPNAAGVDVYDMPRPTPDGERLLVRHVDYNTGVTELLYFARASETWSPIASPPFSDRPAMSTFGRGPSGPHILVSDFGAMAWDEWVDEGGTWRMTQTHTSTQLGVAPILGMTLTTDGLRAIVNAGSPAAMYYAERASVDVQFSPAVPLPTLPLAEDAFMSADCARVYLSGLGYVFYVQQQ